MRIAYFFLLGVILSCGLVSCSDDDSSSSSAAFSVELDGELWEADQATAVYQNGVLGITATRGEEIMFITLRDTVEQMYVVDVVADFVIGYTKATGEQAKTNAFASNEFVNLTDFDSQNGVVSGTFGGPIGIIRNNLATSICNLKDGRFDNITLTTEVPMMTTSTFSGKIDGVDFGANQLVASNLLGAVTLNAVKTMDEFIIIQLEEDITPGRYSELGFVGMIGYRVSNDEGYSWDASSSEYEVLTHDTTNDVLTGQIDRGVLYDLNSGDSVLLTECTFTVAY